MKYADAILILTEMRNGLLIHFADNRGLGKEVLDDFGHYLSEIHAQSGDYEIKDSNANEIFMQYARKHGRK